MLELDVVTGTGALVTCSPRRDPELFHMALAGLGQCGIIVRARLRLVPAPERVLVRALVYDGPEAMVSDQARLARSEGPDVIGGEITRDPEGRWRLVLFAGSFQRSAADGVTTPPLSLGLRMRSHVPVEATSYWEHLDRRTASIAAAKAKDTPNPSLAVVLPQSAVAGLLSYVLATPEASVGILRV